MKIIPDSDFTPHPEQSTFFCYTVNNKPNSEKTILIAPHDGENNGNVIFFKLKILCDDRNWKLVSIGNINKFPLFSIFADEVWLTENSDLTCLYESPKEIYGDHGISTSCYTQIPFNTIPVAIGIYEHRNLMDEHRCEYNLLVEASYISNERVIEKFKNPDVYIRKSSYDKFQLLNLPRNILTCEIKDYPRYKPIIEYLRNQDIVETIGLDRNYQRQLLKEVGSHYMAIQYLASLENNWNFLCVGGSANLFSLLPVKVILFFEEFIFLSRSVKSCLRELYKTRYSNDEIPFIVHDMNELESTIKNNLDKIKNFIMSNS